MEFSRRSKIAENLYTQIGQEIEQIPVEYLPNLLQIVHLFRESINLKPNPANVDEKQQEESTEISQVMAESNVGDRLEATVKSSQSKEENVGNAWDVLEAMIGTIEAPSDWSSEHDRYFDR